MDWYRIINGYACNDFIRGRNVTSVEYHDVSMEETFVGALRLFACCERLILRNDKAWRPDQTPKGVKDLKREGPKSVGPVGGRECRSTPLPTRVPRNEAERAIMAGVVCPCLQNRLLALLCVSAKNKLSCTVKRRDHETETKVNTELLAGKLVADEPVGLVHRRDTAGTTVTLGSLLFFQLSWNCIRYIFRSLLSLASLERCAVY